MENLNPETIKQYYRKCGIYHIAVHNHHYIGSSINLGSRLHCHIWSMTGGCHRNRFMQNCFNKYSLNSFTFEILEYCSADKRIERETYYIHQYNPDINVVEPTTLERNKPEYIEKQRQRKLEYYKTHESASNIPVYQYTKEGQYVTSFISATKAAEYYNVNNSAITSATNGHSITCAGYQWRKTYTAEITSCIKPPVIKVKEKKEPKPGNRRKIYRYSLAGEYIDEFNSCKEADRVLGIHGCHAAANKNTAYRSVGGFLWSFEKKEHLEPYENHSKDAKIKTIFLFDVYTGTEKSFRSIADACRDIITDNADFASLCATISFSARRPAFISHRYLARYEGGIYQVPKRHISFVDSDYNCYPKNNIPKNTEVIALVSCAHNKLREAGKLFR